MTGSSDKAHASALRKAIGLCCVGLLFAGCAQDDDQGLNVTRIFDQSRMHEVRLSMEEAAWDALREHYLDDQYYAVDFSIDGETLRQAGVRSRGYGSRRNPRKPGLRVDMNRYGDCLDYYGLTSLLLDNQLQDATFIRERLAYAVFHAMNVNTPRLSHARVFINDQYLGLYTITEAIDGKFLKDRFGESAGNLFDYESNGWEWNFSWRGESPAAYIPDPFVPKTNETSLDPSALVDFIRVINEPPSAIYASNLSRFIDPESFVRFVAIENAMAEKDGLVGDWQLANFYLYQYAGTTRFVFIPWDRDYNLRSGEWPLYRNIKRNVLAARLIRDGEYNDLYVNTIKHVVTTYVNERWLLPRFAEALQQTRDAALADENKPFTNASYESEVEKLRQNIVKRESDVFRQLGLSVD
jgi:hypothetical protein